MTYTEFQPGLLDRFITQILSSYPRKTFGYFLASSTSNHREVNSFYIFADDARSSEQVSSFFRRSGAYYENNPTAGFLATPQETVSFERWRRREQLTTVGAFHTHLRHPAYLARIDQDLHPRTDLFHLIISLRNPAKPELAVWQPSSSGFLPSRIMEGGHSLGELNAHYFPVLENPATASGVGVPNEVDTVKIGDLAVTSTPVTHQTFASAFPRFCFNPNLADHPVTGVTYQDASAFCNKTGARLLTTTEWVSVCDGIATSGSLFHHNDDLSERAVYSETSGNRSAAVGKRQANKHGLFDMQGNVWEWCASEKMNSDLAPTKGGGYLAFAEMCDPDVTQWLPRDYSAPDLGFRVCFDLSKGKTS